MSKLAPTWKPGGPLEFVEMRPDYAAAVAQNVACAELIAANAQWVEAGMPCEPGNPERAAMQVARDRLNSLLNPPLDYDEHEAAEEFFEFSQQLQERYGS